MQNMTRGNFKSAYQTRLPIQPIPENEQYSHITSRYIYRTIIVVHTVYLHTGSIANPHRLHIEMQLCIGDCFNTLHNKAICRTLIEMY